jgi:hypothetical protein
MEDRLWGVNLSVINLSPTAILSLLRSPRYHSAFKPLGSYPYRRALLAIQARGEQCSPVRWFSRKGEW